MGQHYRAHGHAHPEPAHRTVRCQAQPAAHVPRLGLLIPGSASAFASRIEAFRHGLRDLGYVEGRTIAIEYRFADGQADRLPALAAELVRLPVDAIVVDGP